MKTGSLIENRAFGVIKIADNVTIGRNVSIMSYGGSIDIGCNCVINDFSIVYGHGGCVIGNDTIIGPHCVIIPANHRYAKAGLIRRQGEKKQGVKIGDNVWLGASVTILDGVTIGDNVVIGAGSVVNCDIPNNVMAAGVPAQVKKEACHG